jgi:16S rRNA processing protein RimM
MSSKSSKTTETYRDDLPDRVAVGRVLRPHGLKGEVVVEVLSDVPGRLDPGERLLASRPVAGKESPLRTLTVASSQPHKTGARVRFEGITDVDGAETLRNLTLEVERSQVPPAEPGTYYYFELLGCRCFDGGEDLGEVVDLVEDGGGLLLIVAGGVADGADGRRIPVPFVERFLRGVDVGGKRIDLELPPGLLETCASRS